MKDLADGSEYLYRYEDIHTSLGLDDWECIIPGHNIEVKLHKFRIIKKTPKGAWIEYVKFTSNYINPSWRDGAKFVNLEARKKFACLTKKEALESFKLRKKAQIGLLKSRLFDAELALKIAESFEGD